MPTTFIQPSFAGGELAPSLHARVDLAKYATGLKNCRNMYVLAHGGVSNRPGTEYICSVKDSNRAVRLIPFEFNTEQTYVLEFGDHYIRVIKEGGQVLSHGSPVEITSPYTEADLFELKFTQSADVMTICHPNYAPRTLSRTSHTRWSLSTVTFGTTMTAPTGVTSSAQNYDSAQDARSFEYAVTSVDTSTGAESVASTSTSVINNSLSGTTTNTVTWSPVNGADSYNVYKKKGGVFGFVGRADSTSFTDDNIDSDAADTPPTDRVIFNTSGKYPASVTYYQQRLVYAQSDEAPQTVWLSQVGNYNNFNVSEPLKDDDAVTFTLASRQVNEIRHMVPLANLVLLTSGGEWVMESSDGSIVTPSSINVKPQSYRGASDVPPITIGNTVLYIQSKGAIVRDLAYALESDSYTGNDLTVLSNHLFVGKTVVDWAYAQAPDSIVWTVMSDGTACALTYMREHEVWGWSRHDTDGLYESVCTVSEGNEDAVYFVVKRAVNGTDCRYIERLHSRLFDDVKDAFFVDSGLSYDGDNRSSGTTMRLSGGSTWAHNEDLTLTASAAFFSSSAVGNTVVLNAGNQSLTCTIKAFTSATAVTVRAARNVPTAFQRVAISNWQVGVDEISGLSHLEGKTVSVLADGNVLTPKTVTGGAIALTNPATKIHVGLPIQADFQTLDLEVDQGTIQGKKKTLSTVTLRVEKTRGGKIGPSSDKLTEYKQRLAEPYGDPTRLKTGDIRVTIPSQWSEFGSVFFRQDDPLPVTLLAVMPEVTIGR